MSKQEDVLAAFMRFVAAAPTLRSDEESTRMARSLVLCTPPADLIPVVAWLIKRAPAKKFAAEKKAEQVRNRAAMAAWNQIQEAFQADSTSPKE